MSKDIVLITGSCGQIGTELAVKLRESLGVDNVIASDIREPNEILKASGPFESIDILDKASLHDVVAKYGVNQIYHLASLLSATGEKNPKLAWEVNMGGLLNILDLAKEQKLNKVFWPSSIAVFGPNTPKVNTPQEVITEPSTVYGISKLAGERWCDYYFQKYGLDVRSIRYPGLISYKTLPGGGTTDYAVDIYFKAIKDKKYECFLKEDTRMPMMYMDDAIRGTIDLMDAPSEKISIRSSYNFTAMSFTPEEVYAAIKAEIPEFRISYKPDFRQAIADSWPQSIDDSVARADWNWQHEFDLAKMTKDMLSNIPQSILI